MLHVQILEGQRSCAGLQEPKPQERCRLCFSQRGMGSGAHRRRGHSSYGVTKVLKPIRLGYRLASPVEGEGLLDLQPGELLYTLHYMGEGYELFWYKGQVYTDQIASREPDPESPPPELYVQVLSLPHDVWWAKVRHKDGRVGWTNEPHKFGNVDACG